VRRRQRRHHPGRCRRDRDIVDCLVTADAPNGLIRIGQQLAA
jgi:hypothetical protein